MSVSGTNGSSLHRTSENCFKLFQPCQTSHSPSWFTSPNSLSPIQLASTKHLFLCLPPPLLLELPEGTAYIHYKPTYTQSLARPQIDSGLTSCLNKAMLVLNVLKILSRICNTANAVLSTLHKRCLIPAISPCLTIISMVQVSKKTKEFT